MPVSRFQLRNEYSLANRELYEAADRDDSEAVLEGVAMAGLVGVLRQLGDLAEFAAGIFHDLHEEVMSTAARGHGLMIRVQQLEADFPSIEKAILSLTNHSRFTYNPGFKWHANHRLDQNLIIQGDFPRFIMDSYEECRGPPRLFLLDKFDIGGAGACLKRYSDPSIFKPEFSPSGMKREEVKRENKVRKVKKKGMRWWNEEPLEIFTASDFNAKLNNLASNDNNVSEKTPSHGVKFKRRHLNGSSYNSRTGKSYMECILDMHLPKSFPELNEIDTDDLTKRFLYEEKNLVQSPNRQGVFKLPMVELGKNVINGGYVKAKHMPTAEHKAEEISFTFNQAEKDLLADGISMIEASANGYGSNEFELEKITTIVQLEDRKDALVDRGSMAASDADDYRLEDATSELDNYVDALTAMELEMETDTNITVKHEPAFSKDIRQVDSNMTDEQQGLYAQCLDTYSVKTSSVASRDWSGSLENQDSGHSDLETTSSSDLQISLGKEISSLGFLDMPENCEMLSPSEQTVLGLTNGNFCLTSTEKLKSSSTGEVASDLYLYQIHDMSSGKLSSNGDVLGSESSETLLSNVSGNDVPKAPSHIPELGESPCTSFITSSTSTCGHSSLLTSLNEIQPVRLHPSENFLSSLEINGELPSNPVKIGKQVGDDIPHGAGISIFSSEINEGVQSIQFAEKFPDGSSSALLQLSDSLAWSRGMKDESGISKEVFPIEYAEDCSATEMMRVKTLDCMSGDLPVIETCDLPSGTNDDAILEKAPMEYVHNSLNGKVDSLNLMKEEPVILTKEYQDASSGGTSPQTYSTNVQTVKYSLVIENGVLPNENSECSTSAIDCQETKGLQGDFDKMITGSILLKSPNLYNVGLLESHLEDLGGLPTESSGRVAVSSNSKESTASEIELKDENIREGNHLSSFNVMESSSVHVDLSLLPMEPNFTLEAFPVEASSQSDDEGARCILVEKNLVDCVPEYISPKASSNESQVQVQCFSSERIPDLYGQQSNESSNQGVLTESQNELNPMVVGSTGLDLVPATRDSPDASGFLGCAHHPVQTHIHPGNEKSEAFISLTESDEESELKSTHHCHRLNNEKGADPPTSFHFEPAITSEQATATTSEQALLAHVVLNQSTASEHEEGCSPQCSDLQFEAAQSVEQMGSSHDFKEGIPPPCDNEVDGWKLTTLSPNSSTSAASAPILPAIKLPNTETVKQVSFKQQPNQPVLVLPLTEPNPLQPSLEEMPPLPPLPPIEWRIGKLQYGTPFLGQETMRRQSSFPQLHTRENQNVQQGFLSTEVCQDSPNSSAPLPTTGDGVLQPVFQSLFGEPPQHSKLLTELPAEEPDQPQHGFYTFGKKMVPPRSSSAPLPILQEERNYDKPQDSSQPTTVDDESQHTFHTSVGETPQPANSFARPTNPAVGNPQYVCSILEKKMVPSRRSSTPLPCVEFEKDSEPRDSSPTVKGKMLQPLRSHLAPPIAEDEKIQHGLFASDGERTEPPNPFSSSLILEDKKPNGNVQPKLTQLRDPLIEGVASHKRVLLRRASERIRPEVKPKSDETLSLLEQIRSKSFNLRPAAMKKPALQGPKTNLNVVAMLEKANAIRQAFVGSDEDDEDGWSDS